MKKDENIKIIYKQIVGDKSNTMSRIDDAFDILFDEILRIFNENLSATTK